MKILGMNFGKQPEPITQDVNGYTKNMAFSTPFMKIGKGNLSLPQINKYYQANGIIRFGHDNLYPQLLNQMYYTSSIHGSIIQFITNSIIGAGYEIGGDDLTGVEKMDIKTFEKVNKFKRKSRTITRDYIIHRRVCVIIKRCDNVVYLTRVDPSTIRNESSLKEFTYSSDHSRGNIDLAKYDRYDNQKGDGEWIYIYQDETPGQDVYPIPQYNSILNYGFLDGEIPFLQKSNLQNSIFPSAVIRRPKRFTSSDELEEFREQISGKEETIDTGKLMVLTGNGFDDTPEFLPIPTNQNDKLFDNLSKDLRDNIAIAHGINPVIMGVPSPGSLGNAQELKTAYTIFEKNIVLPNREVMNEIFNDLLEISNIKQELVINNFQIIDDEIVEKNEDK